MTTIKNLPVSTALVATDALELQSIAEGSVYATLAMVDAFVYRGVVAKAKMTSPGGGDLGGITATAVDVTGLTVTWTAVAGRMYKISWGCEIRSTVANDQVGLLLTDAANAIQSRAVGVADVANAPMTLRGEDYFTTLSGSITRKVRAIRNSGTGTISVNNSVGTLVPYIIVENLGPA